MFYKDGKAKQHEKVEGKELPKDLDQKKFDEISKNVKAQSEISKEELDEYLAYIELMGLLAYLDTYEELYSIEDVYGYYEIDEVNPGEYNFDEYDFEDYGYDEPVESDTVEAGYQESNEESFDDEPVTEESVETSIEDETVKDFTNEEVTEEYIESSEVSLSAPESTGDYLD